MIGTTHPESVAAMIRVVVSKNVVASPTFETIVVRIRTIIFLKKIPGTAPAIQNPDENSITTVSTVVLQESVVVGTAFNQHTGRITSMHFARLDANSVTEDVLPN